MTWTKIPVEFLDDVRRLKLPRAVRLLDVEGRIWSNRAGSDAAIPRWALPRFTDEPEPEAAAEQLVAAGLWTATEDGWEIVDFLLEQPSAAEVAELRRLANDRQKRWRHHRQGLHDLCPPTRDCRRSTSASTPHDVDGPVDGVDGPVDAVPVPTGPTDPQGREGGPERTGAAAGSSKRPAPRLAKMMTEAELQDAIVANQAIMDDPGASADSKHAALKWLQRHGAWPVPAQSLVEMPGRSA